LTDPSFVPLLYTRRTGIYLKEHGIQWVVLPSSERKTKTAVGLSAELRQFFILPRPAFGIALGLDKGSGLEKREIVAFSSDPGTWAIGASPLVRKVLENVPTVKLWRQTSAARKRPGVAWTNSGASVGFTSCRPRALEPLAAS
jgi:hypothetical protein